MKIPDKLPEDLNELAALVHKCNEKWWQHPVTKERIERNKGELLMLVITELAEACEGERKNLMDDKLPHRKMAEVECADAVIRLLDFAAGFKVSLFFPEIACDMPDNKGDALRALCREVGGAYNSRHDEIHETNLSYVIEGIKMYCAKHNYDLMGAMREKLVYNLSRQDHTHEARQQAEGKKW